MIVLRIGCLTKGCPGDPPGSPHLGLFLTLLEVILCLFCEKSCLCFWDSLFLPPFDVFPCKLNPEICLFSPLLEAEKRVPGGFVWVMGKEGLFWRCRFFWIGSFEYEKPSAIKGKPENQ